MGLGTSEAQRLITPEVLAPLASIFNSHVLPPDANGCTLWGSGKTGRGYGNFHIGTQASPTGRDMSIGAHRVAWMLANDATPPRHLVVDHLCRVRACVNPDHLQLVQQRTNSERAGTWGFRTARPRPYTALDGRVTWRVRFKQYVDGEARERSKTFQTESAAWEFIEANRGQLVAPRIQTTKKSAA